MGLTVEIRKGNSVRLERYKNLRLACRFADSVIDGSSHSGYLRLSYQTARLRAVRGSLDNGAVIFYFGSPSLNVIIKRNESDSETESSNENEVANIGHGESE